MNGSDAFGWYTLPHPRSYYIDGSRQRQARGSLHRRHRRGRSLCGLPQLRGHQPDVQRPAGLLRLGRRLVDHPRRREPRWRVTWSRRGIPEHHVIAHETGHGFGLPHSSGQYGQTYDNDWDVMSNAWLCTITDPTFGCVGQHTILYHKACSAGSLPTGKRLSGRPAAHPDTGAERAALHGEPRLIRLPISGSSTHFLTVEAAGGSLRPAAAGGSRHHPRRRHHPGQPGHVIDIDVRRNRRCRRQVGARQDLHVFGREYHHRGERGHGHRLDRDGAEPAATAPNGDVNGDGFVNSADLATLQECRRRELRRRGLPLHPARHGRLRRQRRPQQPGLPDPGRDVLRTEGSPVRDNCGFRIADCRLRIEPFVWFVWFVVDVRIAGCGLDPRFLSVSSVPLW